MHAQASVRRAAGALGLGVLAAGLVAVPGIANAAPATHLVINEVYGGGGGSTGSPSYVHDFIELHNPTALPVSLAGWSIQYKSNTGANATAAALSGSVAPGGYFLIRSGDAGTVAGTPTGPTPDATVGLNLSASGGVVFLASGLSPVTARGNVAGVSTDGLVDTVGYGTTADTYEGARTGVALTTTTSASRTGAVDTDHNADDFTEGVPSPQNSGGVTPPPPPPPPATKTIAEIQGTGAASPLVDQAVITKGVVTAAYATGGFNGFYIQTPGEDTTPGASDAVFVYEPGFASTIAIGDSVEVEGVVKEFSGLTEVDATKVTEIASLGTAVPNTELPGSTCELPGTACPDSATLDTLREEFEGEAFLPAVPMTVTDAYDFGVASSSFFGEIGLAANSTEPLVTPTEVIDAQDTVGIAARTAWNNAHLVVLDDGSSANYWNTNNSAGAQDDPLPWLTADHTVRVGAAVTFDQPVILDYRFGWKLQPPRQVVGKPTGLVTFEQDRPAAPAPVGGDIKLATFNVLNYFTTFGADVPGCSPYVDRDDNPIATRTCTGSNGPRGAWNQVNFERQQAKIVNAINTMDADIVSLEELENSLKVDGVNRDEALAALVTALNNAAGSQRWSYVPSPSVIPATEDVIRNGFIYDPATVEMVGESELLEVAAFNNARDPLAQVFKAKGAADATKFAVIVNHFKSKGSGVDDGTGQGNANPDRIAQAKALVAFADSFAVSRGTDKVFLTGDFNAYSMEDPVQEIEAAGFVQLESTDDPNEESYSFAGTSGSLDHVFASPAAKAMVTGVDVWETNANESIFYQYSRYNYVGTDLFRPDVFASSDHNPEVVGIKVPTQPQPPAPVATKVSGVATGVSYGEDVSVAVSVTPANASGKVELVRDGQVLGSGVLQNGSGTIVVAGGVLDAGSHELVLRYLGDATHAPSTGAVTVAVAKAGTTLRHTVKPRKVIVRKTAARIVVRVASDAGTPQGSIKVRVAGKVYKAKVVNGKAVVKLKKFAKPGKYKVRVKYLGSKNFEASKKVFKLRVRR
jgi:predicted extracellular nuclease